MALECRFGILARATTHRTYGSDRTYQVSFGCMSPKTSVQEPGLVRRRAEQPEPLAAGRLDEVIIAAHVGAAPPAGLDPLRSVGVGHDVPTTQPAEARRRVIRPDAGHYRGRVQQPRWP